MSHGHKKLFFLLFIVLLCFCALFVWQIKKNMAMETERSDRPLIEDASVEIPLTKDEPIFGNRGAAITITEFIDLNDETSRKIHTEIKTFVAAHPQDLRLVWKDFPKQSFFGKDMNKIHRAVKCVAVQNQAGFWQFIDDLSTAEKIDENTLISLSEKYVADTDAWKKCVTSDEMENKILDSINFVTALGLKKAPVIFINNRLVNYVTEVNLTDLFEQLIAPKTNS